MHYMLYVGVDECVVRVCVRVCVCDRGYALLLHTRSREVPRCAVTKRGIVNAG